MDPLDSDEEFPRRINGKYPVTASEIFFSNTPKQKPTISQRLNIKLLSLKHLSTVEKRRNNKLFSLKHHATQSKYRPSADRGQFRT